MVYAYTRRICVVCLWLSVSTWDVYITFLLKVDQLCTFENRQSATAVWHETRGVL